MTQEKVSAIKESFVTSSHKLIRRKEVESISTTENLTESN